jgi:hypothetical protein
MILGRALLRYGIVGSVEREEREREREREDREAWLQHREYKYQPLLPLQI